MDSRYYSAFKLNLHAVISYVASTEIEYASLKIVSKVKCQVQPKVGIEIAPEAGDTVG